jgi:hypothetical protein
MQTIFFPLPVSFFSAESKDGREIKPRERVEFLMKSRREFIVDG